MPSKLLLYDNNNRFSFDGFFYFHIFFQIYYNEIYKFISTYLQYRVRTRICRTFLLFISRSPLIQSFYFLGCFYFWLKCLLLCAHKLKIWKIIHLKCVCFNEGCNFLFFNYYYNTLSISRNNLLIIKRINYDSLSVSETPLDTQAMVLQ